MKVSVLHQTALYLVVMCHMLEVTSASNSTVSIYQVMKQVNSSLDDICNKRCYFLSPCKCDEECFHHKDCCKYVKKKQSKPNSVYQYMQCMQLIWKGSTFTGPGYRMVAKCPSTWIGEKIRQKCHNLEENNAIENTPVSSELTSVTYRNMFCAGCHGLFANQTTPWIFKISCRQFIDIEKGSLSSLIQAYLDNGDCFVEITLPIKLKMKFERSCIVNNHIDKCPRGYEGQFTDACDVNLSPVSVINASSHIVYRAYKNIDCMKCDNIQVEETAKDQLYIECGIRGFKGIKGYGLYLTLKFDSLFYGTPLLDEEITKSCKDDEVFLKSEQCVRLYCPSQSTPQNGNCVQYTPTSNKATLNVVYYVNASVDDQTVKRELEKLVDPIIRNCSSLQSFKVQTEVNVYHGFQSGNQCLCGHVNVTVTTLSKHFKERDILCMKSHFKKERTTSSIQIIYRNGINSTHCEIDHETEAFERPFFLFPDYFDRDDAITCPSIVVSSHNGPNARSSNTPGHKDGAVYYVSDSIIDADHVNVTDAGYYICWEFFKEHYDKMSPFRNKTQSDKYKAILSYVCMSLSITSLIITVVHYIVVPKMLTNHTAVLLHLVVVMLLTHATYILGVKSSQNKALCWWVGVFLHCMFLVLFFTMSLSLLQISLQLRNMKNPFNKKSLWHTIFKFVLPGYIASLMITGTTLPLNHLLYPGNVWYGDGVCFITQPFVLLFSFAIPVALCVIFNISVFVWTISFFCLMELPDETSVNTNRNYFWLSVKISTITGASWVIGFVAVFTRIEALEIAFEIASSLQGLFLSFSLISNQLVRSWYRAKYENMLQTFHLTSVEATESR